MKITEQGEETYSGKTAVNWSSSLSYSVSLRASLWAMLSQAAASCLLTDPGPPGVTVLGPCHSHGPRAVWTSHFSLMLKIFKSHCQVHVKLPPHIRSVQQVPKRPTLVFPC